MQLEPTAQPSPSDTKSCTEDPAVAVSNAIGDPARPSGDVHKGVVLN